MEQSEEKAETPSSEAQNKIQDDSINSESKVGESPPEEAPPEAFKKPQLIIGPRRGKIVGIRAAPAVTPDSLSEASAASDDEREESETPDEIEPEKPPPAPEKMTLPLPYREPSWAGPPPPGYKIEVLKSGVILSVVDLSKQSFFVVGRLPVCDIPLQHPTISRYHAILQYRETGDERNGSGYYLYDLESTHGTFWNNCRIRPKTYVKLKGGHMIKFGCSQRKFIISTPPEDEEEESEYSVTELKEMRRLELLEREKLEQECQEEEAELERMRKEKEEAEGVDWGMGEDADEETDLTENPYAQSNNEELFLDDPKKTLRGWFEREGHDLQYQTEEKGLGQFLCWVDLPIDGGRTARAEALVKGKKKESVVQCALEACRILDRHGLLRQATHEGRKRKSRNWEEEDYYDSDEDNFLDRTGTVERKREQRMRNAGKLEAKVETYSSLMDKHSEVQGKINKIESALENHRKAKSAQDDNSSEDALDAFMSHLSTLLLSKSDIVKMKSELVHLRREEEGLRKLIDIAKPANMPSLKAVYSEQKVESVNAKEEKLERMPKLEFEGSGEACEEKSVQSSSRYGLRRPDLQAVEQRFIGEEECRKGDDDSEEKEPMEVTQEDKNEEIGGNSHSTEIPPKKVKKNQRRRADRLPKEIGKNYPEDLNSEDYSMWVPPVDQSGDGKTSLNDKYGY
ncbi:kanadaptin [Diachasma alloeum]|uniref:kanadaptin n=1 Tax=Diachasma alloeum TaxID=454923 RepID=UPI00073835F5|nr:kanadaptin [Diachasma alloeum]